MLLEAIRTFTPSLYLVIRDNPDVFLKEARGVTNTEKARDAIITDGLATTPLSESDREGFRTWVLDRLFLRISSTGYGPEWDARWSRERRLRSADYFARYFSYSIPTGDISDALVDGLVEAANSGDTTAVATAFKTVISNQSYRVFIRKMRALEEAMPVGASVILIFALASTADSIPRERGLGWDWTMLQAGILTSHLAQKLPSEQHFEAVKAAVIASTSYEYSIQVLRFTVRDIDKDGVEHGFLTETQAGELAAIIEARLIKQANDVSIYRFLGDDARSVLMGLFWYGENAALRQAINDAIKREGPDGAEAFLVLMVGKATEMTSGIQHLADIRNETYDAILRLVDGDLLMEILKSRYGSKLDEPEFRVGGDVPSGERVALQFAFHYRKKVTAGLTNTIDQKG